MPIILRLFNALFILNCKFQNCTAIVQLKLTILKSLNLKIFIHYSLNLYRYTANLFKNLEGVKLCRLILRLLKALFFLYCKFQNCTAIVQLKVTI